MADGYWCSSATCSAGAAEVRCSASAGVVWREGMSGGSSARMGAVDAVRRSTSVSGARVSWRDIVRDGMRMGMSESEWEGAGGGVRAIEALVWRCLPSIHSRKDLEVGA